MAGTLTWAEMYPSFHSLRSPVPMEPATKNGEVIAEEVENPEDRTQQGDRMLGGAQGDNRICVSLCQVS